MSGASVYPRGSFGKTPVVALTDHDWAPRNYEEPFMGLSPAGQHIWGSLLIDGRRVVPIRQIQNELAVRLVLFTGDEGDDLTLTRPARVFTGIGELAGRDGLWGMHEPGRADGFTFASGGGHATWREPGTIAVRGEALGNAIQFAIPDAQEPLAYQARFFAVTDASTRHIVGVFGHEQVYMRPGRGWFESTYMRELEQIWIVFVTVFADGSVVHGHLLVGRQNFSLAALQASNGWSLTTPKINCLTLDCDGSGFPERVVFEVDDGSQWTFRPRGGSGGRMSLGPQGPRWREGVVTEAGESREILFSHSWAEVFTDRLSR
ncbi:hypothetical protein [Mycobacterium sp.]|uniref:hypothetical protein n=1 Tax=Mycobacterium sp. TaxID=1785 RepID=UPI001223B4D2|nr:hypothetical protein [Mycobacterium sp.]TAM65119.1 MAG: hypothetical protein EPN51_20040 [Mycobacterium sp.]